MTVYIKNFRFTKSFKRPKMEFDYFTGYQWKRLSTDKKFERENVALYTRQVFDLVVKDLCGDEQNTIKRDLILKGFEADVAVMVQLNASMFKDATKIFC